MAERQRFELWVGYKPTTVFKTAALNHSAISPRSEYNNRSILKSNFFIVFYLKVQLIIGSHP